MSNEQKQKLKDYRKEHYKKYYAEKRQHDNYSIKLMFAWILMRWLLLGWLLLGWLLLIFCLNKTPLGETGCLSNPYFLLTGSSSIQFFNSPPFPNTVS